MSEDEYPSSPWNYADRVAPFWLHPRCEAAIADLRKRAEAYRKDKSMSDEGEFKSLAEADAYDAIMRPKRSNVFNIENSASDKTTEQLAADYKSRSAALVKDMLSLMREAAVHQFQIDFSIQRDPQGQHYAVGPFVIKRY